jgi:alpha-D-ribose 1-methylphosphonate 5-triphosphate synthase subunit PhnH
MTMKTELIWQADTQQSVFRELVECLSYPGTVRNLSHWSAGTPASRAVLATLLDGECTLADPHGLIAAADWPLLQARRASPTDARFVIAAGNRAPDFQPALGSLESPEFGATLIVVVTALGSGDKSLELEGPGIDGRHTLRVTGLHPNWLDQRAQWIGSFPLGVDLILADAESIAALPRTTRAVTLAYAAEGKTV